MRKAGFHRRMYLAAAAATVALAFPAAASGSLLGDLLPGLVSPAGENPVCDEHAHQAFSRFGDNAYYVLMPGGGFEGDAAWDLRRGAKVVRGNEPYYVHGEKDSFSLLLPEGGTATTPPMCFAFGDWHLRFFARDGGDGARVRVTVIVRSLFGVVGTLDAGVVDPATGWRPSPRVGLLLSNVGGLLATDTIQFRFTALRGDAQIDDAHLDPWKNT